MSAWVPAKVRKLSKHCFRVRRSCMNCPKNKFSAESLAQLGKGLI